MTIPPHEDIRRRAAEALGLLTAAALEAGRIALADFCDGGPTRASVEYKQGGSPVTSADLAVDAHLKGWAARAFPAAAWLSEETIDDDARLASRELLIVDPIDGTRAFVAGDPRWAVSIAWVVEGRPLAGVVHVPALAETYAAALGAGATLNGAPIRASARQSLEGARVGGPKTLLAGLATAAQAQWIVEPRIPSLAYRLVKVASGALDAAFASENAHDWDVAGADIVLAEAGAGLSDARGGPLRYNFVASARRPALAAAPSALLPALTAALATSLH